MYVSDLVCHDGLTSRQASLPGAIDAHANPDWHINKPFGYSWFPREIAPVPKEWIATTGNLVFFREHTAVRSFVARLIGSDSPREDISLRWRGRRFCSGISRISLRKFGMKRGRNEFTGNLLML